MLLGLVVLAIVVLAFKLLPPRPRGPAYKPKSPVLGKDAQELYRLLVQALPEHVVLAEVPFAKLIAGPARPYTADFAVLDQTYSVVAVVELDAGKPAARDSARAAIMREAGIKTVRWHVSRMPLLSEIRRLILG